MTTRLILALLLSAAALLLTACGSNRITSPEPEPTASAPVETQAQLSEIAALGNQLALNEAITLDASKLKPPIGERPKEGEVTLTVTSVELDPAIRQETRAMVGGGSAFVVYDPKVGQFVAVHYTLANNANGVIQPVDSVNSLFTLVDDTGRQWEPVSFADYGFAVGGAFALQADGADPRDFLPAGETVDTAVAFDVPKGVSGLRLRAEALDLEVTLQ